MTQRITIQLIMDIGKLRLKFARDGFVIVPKFLNKKELMVLEQESNEAIKKNQIPATGWGAKGVDKIHPWFHKQLRTGKHVELLKALLEDDIKPVHAGFFDRTPGEKSGISPHFDAVGHRSAGATIWIALDKTDTRNGCLYYAPRSHLRNYENTLNLSFDTNPENAFPVEINPGDAAIHDARTVHWSFANKSQRSRRAIIYLYWAASSKPNHKKVRAQNAVPH